MTEEFMTPEVSEMASRLTGETAKKTVEQTERERDCVGTKPLILIMDSQGRVHRFENDHLCLTMTDREIRIYEGDNNGGLPCPYIEFRQWQWIKTYNLPFSNSSINP